jgi:hypothetical protein
MAAGGHLHFEDDYYVSGIKGIYNMNKMTPVWRRSVNWFRSHRICVLASYHFMDGKMRGRKIQMQPECKRIQSWAKWCRSGVDISNGSKVIAFPNIGLQKFKMAAAGQNGGIFRCHLADRFLLSRCIFVPKGMFVAFVVSSQYISLHPYRHTYIRR